MTNKHAIVERIKTMDRLDWVVLACITLKVVTIFMTGFFITYTATITQTTIQQVSTAVEQNPLVNLLFQLKKANLMFEALLIPSLYFAMYFIFRRRLIGDKYYLLELYVYLLFFSSVVNFSGDFGALVGLLLNKGLL